jgi:hypothetical protein
MIGATVERLTHAGPVVLERTGYDIHEGSCILADRFADEYGADVATCATCAETLMPNGRCLNVGACRTADRDATRGSMRRGVAASAPAAWTARGYVD